jgi:hypothetical protein
MTLCDKVNLYFTEGQLLSPRTLISFANKTDHYNIAEIYH